MGWNNVPPNGFPQIPDIEDLEAVVKDVTTLKTTTAEQGAAITNLNSTKANKTDIATEFSDLTNYNAGDLVYYDGALYEFQVDHTAGAWETSEVIQKDLSDIVTTLKSGLTDLTKKGGGSSVDISGATLSDKYTFPADGYIYVSSESDTSGANKAAIVGSNGATVAYIYQPIYAASDIRSLYVRKGMQFYVVQKSANSSMRFTPLT